MGIICSISTTNMNGLFVLALAFGFINATPILKPKSKMLKMRFGTAAGSGTMGDYDYYGSGSGFTGDFYDYYGSGSGFFGSGDYDYYGSGSGFTGFGSGDFYDYYGSGFTGFGSGDYDYYGSGSGFGSGDYDYTTFTK